MELKEFYYHRFIMHNRLATLCMRVKSRRTGNRGYVFRVGLAICHPNDRDKKVQGENLGKKIARARTYTKMSSHVIEKILYISKFEISVAKNDPPITYPVIKELLNAVESQVRADPSRYAKGLPKEPSVVEDIETDDFSVEESRSKSLDINGKHMKVEYNT